MMKQKRATVGWFAWILVAGAVVAGGPSATADEEATEYCLQASDYVVDCDLILAGIPQDSDTICANYPGPLASDDSDEAEGEEEAIGQVCAYSTVQFQHTSGCSYDDGTAFPPYCEYYGQSYGGGNDNLLGGTATITSAGRQATCDWERGVGCSTGGTDNEFQDFKGRFRQDDSTLMSAQDASTVAQNILGMLAGPTASHCETSPKEMNCDPPIPRP